MRIYDIIEKKRDGSELSYDELRYFINGYIDGSIADYQASALLMAIFIRGLNIRETSDMTMIMANSGDMIDLSSIKGVKVDKHSTGGVGDKTTLIIAPIVSACGVPVAKMSGRGLGHTGGTIDKLESIPGFNTSLKEEEFILNVQRIGIAIAGQTGNLAPADKKLYALRDVTATVNNISLIASSIMSKKIAAGADKILLDVKTGNGAFMKTLEEAAELARIMVKIGNLAGKETAAYITDMNVPLGNAIGNSLEVVEALEVLKGSGPEDLVYVCLELSAKMLHLAGLGSMEECLSMVQDSVSTGAALNKFVELLENQGGNPEIVNNYSAFKKAEIEVNVLSNNDGYIESMKTDMLGKASMLLGAGRETKESSIDHSAGIILNKKTGMKVLKGDVLAKLFTNSQENLKDAEDMLRSSFIISDIQPVKSPLILSYID